MDPAGRVRLDRGLRHGQDDDRHAEFRGVDHLDELEALDPALQQRVDEDDVGPHLLDRRERPAAVGQDLEELDALLRVEQTADVLGDLWDILDDEQACLVTRWHRPDDTTRVDAGTRPGCPPTGGPNGLGPWDRGQGLTARRIARSLPGPIGPMS